MTNWLFPLALLLGPALAVVGAIAYSRWDRAYQRRLDIFRAMMRTRRAWLSPDWVGSLNLAPIEFVNFPAVIGAIDDLLTRYGDLAWKSPDGAQRRRIIIDTETAACSLLLRMAEALRIEMRGKDLRTRPIAPFGWNPEMLQDRQTSELMNQILSGARTLKVEMMQSAASAPGPVPAPAVSPQTEPLPANANGG